MAPQGKMNANATAKEERRRAILDAAVRLFAEKGYHDTKMDEVAERAGLSKGALYLYYRSKEDLFCELIEEKMDRMAPVLRAAVDSSTSLEELVANLVRTQLHQREENMDLFRIFTAEQPRADLGLQKSWAKIRRRLEGFVQYLADCFGRFLPHASLEEQRSLALELLGMMNMHTVDWLMRRDTRPLKDRADMIIRHFLRGAAGVAAESERPAERAPLQGTSRDR